MEIFKHKRGANSTIRFQWRQANRQPQSLVGWTKVDLAARVPNATTNALFVEATIVDAANGICEYQFDNTTTWLAEGDYHLEARGQDSQGKKHITPVDDEEPFAILRVLPSLQVQ